MKLIRAKYTYIIEEENYHFALNQIPRIIYNNMVNEMDRIGVIDKYSYQNDVQNNIEYEVFVSDRESVKYILEKLTDIKLDYPELRDKIDEIKGLIHER